MIKNLVKIAILHQPDTADVVVVHVMDGIGKKTKKPFRRANYILTKECGEVIRKLSTTRYEDRQIIKKLEDYAGEEALAFIKMHFKEQDWNCLLEYNYINWEKEEHYDEKTNKFCDLYIDITLNDDKDGFDDFEITKRQIIYKKWKKGVWK